MFTTSLPKRCFPYNEQCNECNVLLLLYNVKKKNYGCFKEIFSIQHRSWNLCNLVPTLIRSCLSHRVPSGMGARHLCFTGSNLPANVIYLVFNISVISLFSTSSSTSLGAQNRCSDVNLGKQQMKIIHTRNCKKTHKDAVINLC